MEGARIVANIKSGIMEKIRQANHMASLRFCFKKNVDDDSPVTFFVSVKIAGNVSYENSKDMNVFQLQFTQRPPDDLIEVMGHLLDASYNSVKRKGDRINLTADTVRRLKVQVNECTVFIQKVPRRCIIRELSFSGAKLIIMGVAKFLVEKESALKLDFEDPGESFVIYGKLVNSEAVEGRQELLAVDMEFNEGTIPMGYKIRINDYFGQFAVAAPEKPPSGTGSGANQTAHRIPPEKSAVQNAVETLTSMKKPGENTTK
jgi:hypothetical protein